MELKTKVGLNLLGAFLSSIAAGVFGYNFIKLFNQSENGEA